MAKSYDVVFIGGGHNALVCAAYLARAGKSVCVLERREMVGGACVTEEIWPGYKVSTAAYVNSLLRPEIIKELELHKFGFELLPRSPSSFSPFPDGQSLLMGPEGATAIEILTGAARPILDRWFESEQLKVTLATDAVIGAMAAPSMPGTAYVLFHHVMGECNGVRGVWGYVRGGMGGISNSIAASAKSKGAEIRTNAEVAKVLVKDGRAIGVVLKDGTEIRAAKVASGADANVTFLKLCDEKDLPAEFVAGVKGLDYSSASLKINVALSELPNFTAVPGAQAGPQHRGTIHISPDMDYIERAYDDAKYGKPAENPILECTIPSVIDKTVAPEGQHLMSMFIQYFPYNVKGADTPEAYNAAKEKFADRCFDILNQYAPNFKKSVINRQVLSPRDIESRFGLTGGNIMQGTMSLSSLAFMRPLPGWAQYKTPIKNLYLCGAATHPGGGVMGACGYNAAKEILKD